MHGLQASYTNYVVALCYQPHQQGHNYPSSCTWLL